MNAPDSAISRPAPDAASSGQRMKCAVKSRGANPARPSQRANGPAITLPSALPASAAATATASASPSTSLRACRGVAPTVRSRPSSRRRAATA